MFENTTHAVSIWKLGVRCVDGQNQGAFENADADQLTES